MAGYGFKLVSVCQSVHPSIRLLYVSLLVFLFPDDNYNGFAPNLVCALIWWRSALGLLIGGNTYFSFGTILNEFDTDMCIDIVETWFGVANGQIS